MILLLRSGTAITSEIGAMKCEKEISYILTLGVSPISYLVAPRIIGLVLCNLFLSIYFFIFLLLFSSFFSFIFSNIPITELLTLVHKKINFLDYIILFFKSTISGLLVGAICCYRGLQCKESITEIPQQNIFAVRHSLISLFLLHGLFILIEAFNSGVLRYLKYA
jgi:phospholipid/cholesterol/gamma-HCH transport system permease protein